MLKKKNHRKQKFKDEANNMQLDKENTQQSNLNSKYLIVLLGYKILILLFVFIVFYMMRTRKVRSDTAAQGPSISALIESNFVEYHWQAATNVLKVI